MVAWVFLLTLSPTVAQKEVDAEDHHQKPTDAPNDISDDQLDIRPFPRSASLPCVRWRS